MALKIPASGKAGQLQWLASHTKTAKTIIVKNKHPCCEAGLWINWSDD